MKDEKEIISFYEYIRAEYKKLDEEIKANSYYGYDRHLQDLFFRTEIQLKMLEWVLDDKEK